MVFEADAHSRLVEALCVCGADEDRADARSHMSVMHNGAPASSKGLGRAARPGCGQSDGLPLLAPDAHEAHLGSVESSAAELVRSPQEGGKQAGPWRYPAAAGSARKLLCINDFNGTEHIALLTRTGVR